MPKYLNQYGLHRNELATPLMFYKSNKMYIPDRYMKNLYKRIGVTFKKRHNYNNWALNRRKFRTRMYKNI